VKVGLCSVTLRDLAPEGVVDVAVRAGTEGIEWGGDVHVPPGETALAADVARWCADAGVAVPSYGSYLAAGKSGAHRVAPVLATAHALGAGNVRVWCPFGAPPGRDDDLFRAAADALAAWSAEAAAAGCTLSLEFHVDTFTETAASTAALLDAAGRPPALFSYWQPVAGRPAVDELQAVAPDVSHVHVFQWEADGERRPLAEGGATWPTLLSTPLGDRWTGDRYAFLEFVRDDDPEQLVADAATLRAWLGGGGAA
jgi:sugar phosphate isomerase/epimerase